VAGGDNHNYELPFGVGRQFVNQGIWRNCGRELDSQGHLVRADGAIT